MGLDLTLMPFEHAYGDEAYSHTLLHCARSSALFAALRAQVREQPVPRAFMSYRGRDEQGHLGYGNTQRTPYGEPLGWVLVRDLVAFHSHPHVRHDPQNRAVWAYLAALPPDTKVALYWE